MNIVTRGARFASVDLLLDSGYLWLARDLNGSIAAYSHKPFKLDDEVWRVEEGESKEMWMWVDDGDLYNFVKWEDDAPVNIREWVKEEAREMKLYYVRNGELESKDVDVDFFEKYTTLGGLLTPKEVELDRDNKIVTGDTASVDLSNLDANSITTGTLYASNMWLNPLTGEIEFTNPTTSDEVDVTNGMVSLGINDVVVPDGANMIKVNARNSGKSIIIEKAKKIREALESETKSSSGWELGMQRLGDAIESPSYEATVPEDYAWRTDGVILDVASMHTPLTFEKNPVTHEFICDELYETYKKKNADYGNSFENSLDKHGLIAGIIRMDDKMSRLISLNSKNERQVMDESLRDTLMDLANYAIMSVMWLDEQ